MKPKRTKTKTTKAKKRQLVDRLLAAEELGVARPTIERLVAEGRLRAVDRRGPAHLYDIADVRKLAHGLAHPRASDAEILRQDYATSAEDYRDRARALRERFVADADWLPAWRACCRWFARRMSAWPGRARRGLAETPEAERGRLDAPALPGESPREFMGPAKLEELLDETPPRWPWLALDAGRAILRSAIARGQSLWAGPAGHHESGQAPRPPVVPIPFVDDLLAELSAGMRPAREFADLDAALRPPAAPRPARSPKTVGAARSAWRLARSQHREMRVAVRRGHRERADVQRRILAVQEALGARWRSFSARAAALTPDLGEEEARRLVEETTIALSTLDGFLPAIPPDGGC